MPSRISFDHSPLAAEYLEKKKQVARSSSPMSARKRVAQDSPPQNDTVLLSSEQSDNPATPHSEDTVTLSSGQSQDSSLTDVRKPSQPVTLEEKLALMSEFSIRI